MPSAMRKMAVYLGLVEDNREYEDYQDEFTEEVPRMSEVVSASSRFSRQPISYGATALAEKVEVRPQAQANYDSGISRITTLHPRSYNEARRIGEEYRMGVPVIMNLTDLDDVDAKRIVDFAAGLVFGLKGSIEKVTTKVFLLSPANVDLGAAARAQLEGDGFFNQS
jgi:cell division inhibitor SepF